MDPNQNPQPQPGYPPQTPQPQAGPAPYQPTPQAYPPQQPQAPQSYTPPQSHQSAQSQWYTPAPKPDATKPADVSSYLQSAGIGQQPQQPVPGQQINGQYSIDYLDQMAVPVKKPLEKKYLFAGIGVGVALILTLAVFMFTPKRAASTASEISLYTTMIDVEKSTDRSERSLKSSGMSSANSALRSTLTNAARDMQTPLTNMGQNPSTLKSAAVKPPYHDDKLVTALEDARLNGIYDRVYAREMNTKMKLMISYMESIETTNSRESMQEFVKKNKKNFKDIQKSVEDWQSSDEAQFF